MCNGRPCAGNGNDRTRGASNGGDARTGSGARGVKPGEVDALDELFSWDPEEPQEFKDQEKILEVRNCVQSLLTIML